MQSEGDLARLCPHLVRFFPMPDADSFSQRLNPQGHEILARAAWTYSSIKLTVVIPMSDTEAVECPHRNFGAVRSSASVLPSLIEEVKKSIEK